MASSLISNINSASQQQANLLCNTPNLVKVLVEDELDVAFWYRVLKTCAPSYEFDVKPYSYDYSFRGKGKAQILAQKDQFGKYYIGCVDSDYDWILQKWTADGAVISGSKYILQTYAYSLENLAAQPYGLTDCMMECCMHGDEMLRSLDKDYSEFILTLSKTVYEVLLWHLALTKEQLDPEQVSLGWIEIFCNGHYNDIHNDNSLTLKEKRESTLKRFSERANNLIVDYGIRYPQLKPVVIQLEEDLKSENGLTPENAYLYVRGHNMHEFLLYNFFEPLQKQLVDLHIAEIAAHTIGPDTGNAIRHYKNNIKDFGRDYIHRESFMNYNLSPISHQIKEDIENLTKIE